MTMGCKMKVVCHICDERGSVVIYCECNTKCECSKCSKSVSVIDLLKEILERK